MEETRTEAASDMKPEALKAKRKLKLTIPVDENPQNQLIALEGTTSFLLEGQVKRRDEAKGSSSSASRGQKTFFKRSDSKDFDDEGGYYCARGRNNGKIMEDKHTILPEFKEVENCSFYGVYDGHSTVMIAEMLKENLHNYVMYSYREQGSIHQAYMEGFEKIEKEAIAKLEGSKQKGGSTALCSTIIGDYIYTANLGDSRAVVISEDGYQVLNNLHDYNNKNEELAVAQKGGVVIERGTTKRLFGEFALSRSIGDFHHKKYISATPEISEHQINSSDIYLLIATDGFWNVIAPEKAYSTIKLIQNDFKELDSLNGLSQYLIEMACNANQNVKKDNMILMIIDLKKLPKNTSTQEECKI